MTAIANDQVLYPSSINISKSHNPTDREDSRKVRLIESNAKCRYLKKLTCKETWQQVFLSVWGPFPFYDTIPHTVYTDTVYIRVYISVYLFTQGRRES
jgi:hypothetical protein